MRIVSRFEKLFKLLLPAPFTIAVLLTILTYFLALFITDPDPDSTTSYPMQLLLYWEEGLWNNTLIVFAFQMMLMLVLGHVLALSKPVRRVIDVIVTACDSTAKAAAIVAVSTMLVSFFNWGLGLVFGAILARKVGEFAADRGSLLNYGLVGAAGYSGLMVWHGGLSGSSLAKVAEPGHLQEMMAQHFNEAQLADLPERIGYAETVFSGMNMTVWIMLLLIIPGALFVLGSRVKSSQVVLRRPVITDETVDEKVTGAEHIDRSMSSGIIIGCIILFMVIYKMVVILEGDVLAYFTPNNINFMLLGLALLFHGSFMRFLKATDQAIGGAAGILIQFPLYFGIMGIMNSSGLVTWLSDLFVSISNSNTYPLLTYTSAGIVNIFVPSGGGQWAVQGPILVKAAMDLQIPLNKSIMALAYGDQLTNMLQPFWALPLLGITGLKAKEILPYTLLLFLLGGTIFTIGLLIF